VLDAILKIPYHTDSIQDPIWSGEHPVFEKAKIDIQGLLGVCDTFQSDDPPDWLPHRFNEPECPNQSIGHQPWSIP